MWPSNLLANTRPDSAAKYPTWHAVGGHPQTSPAQGAKQELGFWSNRLQVARLWAQPTNDVIHQTAHGHGSTWTAHRRLVHPAVHVHVVLCGGIAVPRPTHDPQAEAGQLGHATLVCKFRASATCKFLRARSHHGWLICLILWMTLNYIAKKKMLTCTKHFLRRWYIYLRLVMQLQLICSLPIDLLKVKTHVWLLINHRGLTWSNRIVFVHGYHDKMHM